MPLEYSPGSHAQSDLKAQAVDGIKMGTLLQQLQNNQALLVMYLADELEPEDRADVEQRLAADAGLRADLTQLQEAQNVVTKLLQQMDENSALPATADVASRRVSRMMKQRQLDLLSTEPLLAPRQKRHIPWWVYWVASAAAAVVAVVVWWGMQSDVTLPSNSSAVATSNEQQEQQQEQVALLDLTMRNVDDNAPITDAETQAQILLTRRNDIDKPLSLHILGADEQPQ
jgi:anti-sigma factor RsiW